MKMPSIDGYGNGCPRSQGKLKAGIENPGHPVARAGICRQTQLGVWVQISTSSRTTCTILGKLLNFSVSQFSQLEIIKAPLQTQRSRAESPNPLFLNQDRQSKVISGENMGD